MAMSMSDLISRLTAVMSEAGNVMVTGIDDIAHVVTDGGEHVVAIVRGEEPAASVGAAAAETSAQEGDQPAS